jgi:anion transporter
MNKKYVFLLLALLTMLGIIFLTPATTKLSHAGKVALGVGVFAIIVWVTQALDDAQSGFCIVAFLALFGGARIGQALSGYATTGVWIVALGMVMAAGMEKSGLSRRVALRMVAMAGSSPKRLYWMVALITLVMTFFIPSLGAKTLLLTPILAQMAYALGAEKGQSSLVKGLVFVVTITGTMFCIGILTSHAANPITASLLASATNYTVAWADWFRIGMPPALICGLLAVPILQWMWPPDMTDISAGQAYVKDELEKMGPMSKIEVYTLIVFLLTLTLWATDTFHKINSTLVALMCVLAMIAPGPQQIMNWKEAEKKVPWNIFIVYGAGLSMGAVLVSSGAAKWVAETFFYGLVGIDMKLQVVIFIWLMLLLQVLFTGAGPKTTAFTPVIIAYALATGLSPTPFVLLVGMNMLHQYLLPVSNLPNIIGLATEEITPSELIKTGAVMSLVGATFMTVMVYTYWTWIGMFD